jgi:hypothetical protein
LPGERLYLVMEKRPSLNELIARFRAQPWSREVLLAALLTIAAVVFIAAAIVGRDDSGPAVPVETARQPPG